MSTSTRPWEGLPPELADTLAPELPALADEIIVALGDGITEYALPLEGRFGRTLRLGVEEALATFLRFVAEPPAGGSSWPATYRMLGAGEWHQGRSLDALQAAYRLGARVAWRRLADAAAAHGVDAATQRLLAEAIFAYIDELSAESVAGYAEAQSAAAGEREARRRRLATLLLTEPAAQPVTLAEVARDAAWTLPRTLTVVVLESHDRAGRAAGEIGPDVLIAPDEERGVLVVPDPKVPARRRAVRGVLARSLGAQGPVVAPEFAGRSARWARAALTLTGDGRSVLAEDRLADLALLEAEEPLAALAERRLAAFDAVPERRRALLQATLLAWLRRRGSAPQVAEDLHVHPQTVRYRLAGLRELLGDAALDDPDSRFELELCLRAAAAGALRRPEADGATA